MSRLKISGKELRKIGYPEGPVISVAMNVMEKHFKHLPHAEAIEILNSILRSPNQYADDAVLGNIAKALVPKEIPPQGKSLTSMKPEFLLMSLVVNILRKVPCTK